MSDFECEGRKEGAENEKKKKKKKRKKKQNHAKGVI
jgi:hypothetical protein